jgi:hypothetical protein
MATLVSAVKKEIKKAVKANGSHIGTVKHALSIQFPSVDFADFESFTKNELAKKYANA